MYPNMGNTDFLNSINFFPKVQKISFFFLALSYYAYFLSPDVVFALSPLLNTRRQLLFAFFL